MEDFGRPFTEIRAVLAGKEAVLPSREELRRKLSAISLDQDPMTWSLCLATSDEVAATEVASAQPKPLSQNKRCYGLLTGALSLVVIVLIATAFMLPQFIQKNDRSHSAQAKPNSCEATSASKQNSPIKKPQAQQPPSHCCISIRYKPADAIQRIDFGKYRNLSKKQEKEWKIICYDKIPANFPCELKIHSNKNYTFASVQIDSKKQPPPQKKSLWVKKWDKLTSDIEIRVEMEPKKYRAEFEVQEDKAGKIGSPYTVKGDTTIIAHSKESQYSCEREEIAGGRSSC